MDVSITNQNINFAYDPQLYGYDATSFKTLTGTPATNGSGSSTVLRLTSAEIATYNFYKYADVTFVLTVPVAPTAGQVRAWGFKVPVLGNKARAEFDITDDVFSCKLYDDYGTSLGSTTVTWDATWTAAKTRFRISLTKDGVMFFVDKDTLLTKTCVARFAIAGNADQPRTLPTIPQTVHVNNGTADNLDVTAILVRGAQGVYSQIKLNSISGTVTVTGGGASAVDGAAFTLGSGNVAPSGYLFDDVAPAAPTEGAVGVARMDANKAPYSTLATQIAGENITANVLHTRYNGSFLNITTATTTTVKSGAGHIHAIIVNLPVATGVITVYDNTAASGTKLGTTTFGATVLGEEGNTIIYDCNFATGLTIVTSAATDITVIYS